MHWSILPKHCVLRPEEGFDNCYPDLYREGSALPMDLRHWILDMAVSISSTTLSQGFLGSTQAPALAPFSPPSASTLSGPWSLGQLHLLCADLNAYTASSASLQAHYSRAPSSSWPSRPTLANPSLLCYTAEAPDCFMVPVLNQSEQKPPDPSFFVSKSCVSVLSSFAHHPTQVSRTKPCWRRQGTGIHP